MPFTKCLSIFLTLSFFCLSAGPRMVARPVHLYFPTPSAKDLDRGYLTVGKKRLGHGLRIDVEGDGNPWRLELRSRSDHFMPRVLGKSASTLYWKHNHEQDNAFRKITFVDEPIFISRDGRDDSFRLDFKLFLSWEDQPGHYGLDLVFTLISE